MIWLLLLVGFVLFPIAYELIGRVRDFRLFVSGASASAPPPFPSAPIEAPVPNQDSPFYNVSPTESFLKDSNGRVLARIDTDPNGCQSLYQAGSLKARYNPITNQSFDSNGRLLGFGNLLASQV